MDTIKITKKELVRIIKEAIDDRDSVWDKLDKQRANQHNNDDTINSDGSNIEAIVDSIIDDGRNIPEMLINVWFKLQTYNYKAKHDFVECLIKHIFANNFNNFI